MKLRPLNLKNLDPRPRRAGGQLLAMTFDGGRLEAVELLRTNGSVEVRKSLSVSMSLDPLTGDADLVGREIRNHLEAAGIRERHCVVGLPLSWTLVQAIKLPELPEADLEGFLQLEAERGFPYDPASLMIARSKYLTAGGDSYVSLIAIPRDHVLRLESVLRAAQLRPVSFSLGIAALQPPEDGPAEGVLALAVGESSVSLQVSVGGGVAVLRAVEGAFEVQGGRKRFQVEPVAREVRITLGQLPAGLRDSVRESVRLLRVFGQREMVEEIAAQLGPRVEALGLQLDPVGGYPAELSGVRLPPGIPVSAAFSLGVRYLAGQSSGLEFLPPKVSRWQQVTARYSSRKLVWAGAAAGAVVLVVLLAFLVQQAQLAYWGSKWDAMKTQVVELDELQQRIKQFRPWFDESFRSLSVMRCLSEAFPEDGSVSAKTVEIRGAGSVSCTGTARDNPALQRALDKLRAARGVTAVQLEQMRGRAPMQFTFKFQWNESTSP
ncbi:MAG: hypothetical protein ACYDC1_12850 [Limisphaerales bacterium]